jgi:glutathione S-transferase
MLALYHYPFSTCSQKVRLVLAEKALEFTSHEIDLMAGAQHDPAYVHLNPNHVVPTLVHEGVPIVESTLINEYLDDAFPVPPLMPRDPCARHRARLWTRRLDDEVHPATAIVTFAVGPRQILLAQPEAIREANVAAIPDPVARAARRSVIAHGIEAPEFAAALRTMLAFLDALETTLATDAWLGGTSFGLADAAALPYVLRLDHLAMTPLVAAPARPALAAWYARVQARASFATAVAAWIPEPALQVLRFGGATHWPRVEAIAAGLT